MDPRLRGDDGFYPPPRLCHLSRFGELIAMKTGTNRRRKSQRCLWEVAIYFAPVESANKGDGITVYNQTDPIIAGSDTEIRSFRFQFFQVTDGGNAVDGFNFQNDFLYSGQEIFVLGMSFQILGKALGKSCFHALPSRMPNTAFRLAAPVFSPC